jgi:2',3'-cyclic-nucleotide 2'-phosphodiesterase (5'-nucleotidase family)
MSAIVLGTVLLVAAPTRAGEATRITISIVGTNDLHGHIETLPRLGGYLTNLRRKRLADGGGVVLLDAGDMFQGTLESNLGEGAAVIRAYNVLKYDAIAIGNHDFDFGPVGPAIAPRAPADDPRGALKARAAEAQFPFLAANLMDDATGVLPAWPNVGATKLLDVAGVKIGIIGLANVGTAFMTLPANFAGLHALPLAPIVTPLAKDLRTRGAAVVVVVAHVGGSCAQLANPDDLSSCDTGSEIFRLARALPRNTVDAIVAGHTHAGIAHRFAGVPIIESYDKGGGFGRIDIDVSRPTAERPAKVIGSVIHPFRPVPKPGAPLAEEYEGAAVKTDPAVEAAIAPAQAAARRQREQKLGITVVRAIVPVYLAELALGNLFADLMRVVRPKVDVVLISAGSLRAELPAGPLTYGQLYEALPFDDRLVTIPITGADLATIVARNLERGAGILALSGVRATSDCVHGALGVTLMRSDGTPIAAATPLTLVTNEFLATGGADMIPGEVRAHAAPAEGKPIRDVMADLLRARRVPLDPGKPPLYDPAQPRLDYPGRRPVRCREFSTF